MVFRPRRLRGNIQHLNCNNQQQTGQVEKAMKMGSQFHFSCWVKTPQQKVMLGKQEEFISHIQDTVHHCGKSRQEPVLTSTCSLGTSHALFRLVKIVQSWCHRHSLPLLSPSQWPCKRENLGIFWKENLVQCWDKYWISAALCFLAHLA